MEVPRTFWKRSVSGAGRCWASVQGYLGRASLGVPLRSAAVGRPSGVDASSRLLPGGSRAGCQSLALLV